MSNEIPDGMTVLTVNPADLSPYDYGCVTTALSTVEGLQRLTGHIREKVDTAPDSDPAHHSMSIDDVLNILGIIEEAHLRIIADLIGGEIPAPEAGATLRYFGMSTIHQNMEDER